MLQRIQTLFLLVIAILSALLFILPFEHINSSETSYSLSLNPASFTVAIKSMVYLPVALNSGTALIALVTIFLFRKRTLQMKLSILVALLSILLLGSFFLFDYLILPQGHEAVSSYTFVAFLPLVNAALALLAKRYIKKDDDLVRSADRIR